MPINKKGNVVQSRVFRVKRTNTTAFQAANLPSQSIIVGFRTFGAASNAGTTAVLSLGSTSSVNDLVTVDVKAGDGYVGAASMTFASKAVDTSLAFTQQSTGIPVFAQYSETGVASSAGGDWIVVIEFI